MFDRMQRKLTWQYSGVLTVFLTLFVVIVYVLLYLFIWSDQRARLSELADKEIQILQEWVNRDDNPKRLPPRSVEGAFSISPDQAFYYLIAENGNVQLGSEMQTQLRAQVLELIKTGHFQNKRMEKVTLQTFDAPSAKERIGGRAEFLVVDRDLRWNGKRIGKLYVGKEVTFQHQLFRYLLVLLIGLAGLFFVLALWLSHYMSRKAIIPVESAYERQREFAADASHELRTPLSVLLTSIEALEGEGGAASGDFADKVLRGMKEEVQSLAKLTGDLLQLARSDSGALPLECAPFNVKGAARGVLGKLQPLAGAKEITVNLHVAADLTVCWDAARLTQLLVLLTDNAIKYTPEGGTVDVTLQEVLERKQRMLAIEVRDDGIGISPAAQARIFDRFYRQDKARSRQSGGHGLGLAIARHIVESSRGTIEVDSKEDEGSTFKVRVPLGSCKDVETMK